MQRFLSLPKLRLFHWCLIALAPVAVLVIIFRLEVFPRFNWSLKRAIALSVGPSFRMAPDLDAARKRLSDAARSSLAFPLPDARITILKSQRRAELYSGGKLIKSYKIMLGSNPAGHKKQIGDGRTPEGKYRICTCLYRSTYYIFLGINYPRAEDCSESLQSKAISEADASRIIQAEQNCQRPPWDTQLGGAIGLHGGGTESDWTDGCIAFANADIEEICVATEYWTLVEIRP